MIFQIDVLTLIAFLGTFQALVFALIFWIKNKYVSNKIFALLMLAASVRIAKNIFVHMQWLNKDLFSNAALWQDVVYVGISHQFAIGPLFLLYFQSKSEKKFKFRWVYLFHFLPYLITLILSPFVSWVFWKNGGLWFSYISILTYYLFSLRHYYINRVEIDEGTRKWLGGILIFAALMLIAYSPALFHYVGYIGGAILYAIGILAAGYFMLTSRGSISFFRTKYDTSSLKTDKRKELREKLELIIETEQPYLNPELTLTDLAKALSTKAHHLSRVINQEFNMSFTDYINSFRLREAESRLLDSKYSHLKISALAFECGFNSVPTFNTLFKKIHKMTPSDYRRNKNS